MFLVNNKLHFNTDVFHFIYYFKTGCIAYATFSALNLNAMTNDNIYQNAPYSFYQVICKFKNQFC